MGSMWNTESPETFSGNLLDNLCSLCYTNKYRDDFLYRFLHYTPPKMGRVWNKVSIVLILFVCNYTPPKMGRVWNCGYPLQRILLNNYTPPKLGRAFLMDWNNWKQKNTVCLLETDGFFYALSIDFLCVVLILLMQFSCTSCVNKNFFEKTWISFPCFGISIRKQNPHKTQTRKEFALWNK